MKYKSHIISLSLALMFGSLIQVVHANPESHPVSVKEESPQARNAHQVKIDVVKSGIVLHDQSAMRTVLTNPGAEYIKVYFSEFSLPGDAYVELSHPTSGERYRYTNDTIRHDQQGLIPAMSISGGMVIVEIVDPSNSFDSSQHSVVIDSYYMATTPALKPVPPGASASATFIPNVRTKPVCLKDEKDDLEKQALYHYSRPVALVYNNNLDANGSASAGTAWRVGEPIEDENGLRFLMLTNHHVITDIHDDSEVEIWFDHEHLRCYGNLEQSDVAISKPPVKFSVKRKLHSNPGAILDYQLFELQVPPEDVARLKSFGYLGLDITQPEESQRIYVPQHGLDPNVTGWPSRYLKTVATVGFNGGDCKITNSSSGRPTNFICLTTGASSGAPLIRNDTHTVIALNRAKFGLSENGPAINFAGSMSDIWNEIAPYFDGVVPESYPIVDPVIEEVVAPDTVIDSNGNKIVVPDTVIDSNGDEVAVPYTFIDSNGKGIRVALLDMDSNGNEILVPYTFMDSHGMLVVVPYTIIDSNSNKIVAPDTGEFTPEEPVS